ncbi:nucleotidyltransferase domain-containing protein [Streptomyces sp. NPDC008313]|uniref:nucleotidyltransferase domain-containing protein n=1 Tax=Streptomyces sp. NPDC008313 TaxID=3364826 RepID=UPI0036E7DB8E
MLLPGSPNVTPAAGLSFPDAGHGAVRLFRMQAMVGIRRREQRAERRSRRGSLSGRVGAAKGLRARGSDLRTQGPAQGWCARIPRMAATETDLVLERFVSETRSVVPTVAVWAHGSLALGDFQPGRSDLDLIAIVESPLDDGRRDRLAAMHQRLMDEEPAAARLHCSYMAASSLIEAEADHLTWAHGMILERPVTPVTRRELLDGGLTLHGPSPAELLPPLTHGQLEDFIRRDLAGFWLPATGKPLLWLRDVRVDLGLLVLARATVTLRDGRLITKGEALAELLELGAPADVVRDIRERRYAEPAPIGPVRRIRRGMRARAFVRRGINHALAPGAQHRPGIDRARRSPASGTGPRGLRHPGRPVRPSAVPTGVGALRPTSRAGPRR